MNVAAVILAAGASTRLGQPKQMAMLGGQALLERAVRSAYEASLEPVIVVLGAHAAQVQAAFPPVCARYVVNETWLEGMASSVRAGIGALPEDLRGVVLMTCDQPSVTADHLQKLVARGLDAGKAVASSYASQIGVPAFFPSHQYGELLGLSGDVGARSLLRAAHAVPLPNGELDIDTPEALAEARDRYG